MYKLEIYDSQGQGSNSRKTIHCNAVVIDREYALTAANCVFGISSRAKVVLKEDSGKEYEVSGLVVHPKYNERPNANDIALVELSSALPEGTATAFLNIRKYSEADSNLLMAVGVGHEMSFQEKNIWIQAIEPQRRHKQFIVGTAHEYSYRKGTLGLCRGEAGAALLHPGQAALIGLFGGILSDRETFDGPCPKHSYVMLFTPVAKHVPWILGAMYSLKHNQAQ